jgi:predicted transposase YdaD
MSPVKKTKRLHPAPNPETSLDVLFKDVFWETLAELLPMVFHQSVSGLDRITQEVVFPEKGYPDLLAWVNLADGTRQLVHLEIQNRADARMNQRMFVYAAFLYHRFGCLPIQVVLYVGEPEWELEPVIAGNHPLVNTVHRYSLIQLRRLDSEVFLATNQLGGLLLAALGHAPDPERLALTILERAKILAKDELELRDFVTRKLIAAIALRPRWSKVFHQTIRTDMPIVLEDLRKSEVIQYYVKEGLNEGLERGKLETTREMFRQGLGFELIKQVLKLEDDTLKQLQAEARAEENSTHFH